MADTPALIKAWIEGVTPGTPAEDQVRFDVSGLLVDDRIFILHSAVVHEFPSKAYVDSVVSFDLENILIADNTAGAFSVNEGVNNYFNIDTLDGSEAISLGNPTTNPSFSLLGTGDLGVGIFSTKGKLHLFDATADVVSYIETDKVDGIAKISFENDVRTWSAGVFGDSFDQWKVKDDTAGLTRVSIDSIGNVSIGSDFIDQKLTVFDGAFSINSITSALIQLKADTDNTGTNNDAYIQIFNNGVATALYSFGMDDDDGDKWKVSAGNFLGTNDRIVIDLVGNVDVLGGDITGNGGSIGLTAGDGTTGGGAINIDAGNALNGDVMGSAVTITGGDARDEFGGDENGGNVILKGGGNDGGGGQIGKIVLQTDPAGFVGIGTTDPDARLTVFNNDSGTGISTGIRIAQNGAGDSVLHFDRAATQVYSIGFDTSADQFRISASSDLNTNPRLVIDDTTGNIGIGSASSPGVTALLELTSTAKGFLPPRMNTTQRDAITSPATGLEIYNTTTNEPNFFNGSIWGTAGGGGTLAQTLVLGNVSGGTDIEISSGDSIITPSSTVGGNLPITLGDGSTGTGGTFSVNAGDSGGTNIGGGISLTGGQGGVTDGVGGAVNIDGGAGQGNADGGNVNIDGGILSGTGTTGDVILQASGGNVGIGTSSPDFSALGISKSLVVRDTNFPGIILSTGSTDADADLIGTLSFVYEAIADVDKRAAFITAVSDGTTATDRGGKLLFGVRPDAGDNPVTAMSILETGIVSTVNSFGVGTETPNNTASGIDKTITVSDPLFSAFEANSTRADTSGLAIGAFVVTWGALSDADKRLSFISTVSDGVAVADKGGKILIGTKPDGGGGPVSHWSLDNAGETILNVSGVPDGDLRWNQSGGSVGLLMESSTGNVGIGSATIPATNILYVEGDITKFPLFKRVLADDNSSYAGLVLTIESTLAALQDNFGNQIVFKVGDTVGESTLGRLEFLRIGADNEGQFRLHGGTNGNEIFLLVNTNGNVGIGTDDVAPLSKLEVKGGGITCGRSTADGFINLENSSDVLRARITSNGDSYVLDQFGVGTASPGILSSNKTITLLDPTTNPIMELATDRAIVNGELIASIVPINTNVTGGSGNGGGILFRIDGASATDPGTSITLRTKANTGSFSDHMEIGQDGKIITNLDGVATGDLQHSPGTKFDGRIFKASAEVQTTDATVTTLNSLALEDENAYHVKVKATAVQSDGSNRASYEKIVTVYRTGAGSATIQGSISIVHESESNVSWDLTLDVSGNNVRVRVTGIAATTIEWGCQLEIENISN